MHTAHEGTIRVYYTKSGQSDEAIISEQKHPLAGKPDEAVGNNKVADFLQFRQEFTPFDKDIVAEVVAQERDIEPTLETQGKHYRFQQPFSAGKMLDFVRWQTTRRQVLDVGRKVGFVANPFAIQSRDCGGPEGKVITLFPVGEIVAAFVPRQSKVGNLIMVVATTP